MDLEIHDLLTLAFEMVSSRVEAPDLEIHEPLTRRSHQRSSKGLSGSRSA